MGSFNTTCFASGQTIAPGDRCYVLPVRQAHDYSPVEMTVDGQSHSMYGITSFSGSPHAFWEPAGDFIEAKYDDCFKFDVIRDPRNAGRLLQFIGTLVEKAPVVAQGENKCHDVPVDLPAFIAANLPLMQARQVSKHPGDIQYTEAERETFIDELLKAWDYVLDAAYERRLFMMDQRQPFPVQFAVLHAAAYDRLIAMTEERKGWDGESLARRSHFDRALAKAHVEMDAEMQKELADAQAQGNEAEVRTLHAIHRMTRDSGFRDEFQRIGRCEGLNYPGEFPGLMYRVRHYLDGKLDVEALYKALRPMLDTRYVMNGLHLLNQRIKPMSYCSQDYDNEIGGRYADFVRATADTVTQGRRDHYGEDF